MGIFCPQQRRRRIGIEQFQSVGVLSRAIKSVVPLDTFGERLSLFVENVHLGFLDGGFVSRASAEKAFRI